MQEASKIVSSEVIARFFGMTSRRVNQLAKEGVIEVIKEKGTNKYDLVSTVQRYIKFLSDKANGRDDCGNRWEEKKLQAESELKSSKAAIAKLQLNELEGKMHRSEDVEAAVTDLVFSIRSMLMALPGRLAVDVAAATTAAEASQVIRTEIHKILEELAGYKYSPEEYARRVREREGWSETAGDGDDE